MTEPVIRAQSLSKIVRSGDAPLTILDGVSFEVGAGSTVAIVGPSGSGKTTLLGLLAGLDRPTTGEVWLGDTALNGLSEDQKKEVQELARRIVNKILHSPSETLRGGALEDRAQTIMELVRKLFGLKM